MSKTTTAKTALMIGATSSLMQSLCRALAARGFALVLAGRNEGELQLLAADLFTRFSVETRLLPADLLDAGFSAVDFIALAGDFDTVVIGVGDMAAGQDELDAIAYAAHINYIVPSQIAQAAAQRLADAGGGSVVIISSVAGDRGRASNYVYGSAKAAISTFASGLRNRYAKTGVHVMTVKPGFTDTPMTWGMHSPLVASRHYVADKIAAAMEKRKDVVYVPFYWRFIMLIIMHIPERVFKKLKL